MHTNSLPPSDRDTGPDPVSPKAAVIGSFTTKPSKGNPQGIERRIFASNLVLRAKLLELRDAPGSSWSNGKLGDQLGVTSGVISQYLNERGCIYDGDVIKLESGIDDFLRNYERRRVSGIATDQFKVADQMLAAFQYIRLNSDIGAIVGPSGVGKTRGVEIIRQKNELVLHFTVRAWTNDKNSLLHAIWDVAPHSGYNPQTKRASFLATSLRGSNRPLVIDDAHKLTRPALQLLFDLYDETNIPICLIGTDALIPKLSDDPQRLSRVGIHWPIIVEKEDRVAMVNHQIDSIAKDCNGDESELRDLCLVVAEGHGGFRSVEKELRQAAELRSHNPKLTWPIAFRKAHDLLLRQYELK